MINLTDSALNAVRNAISTADKPVSGLRIMVEAGGCAGLKYNMGLVNDAEPEDTVNVLCLAYGGRFGWTAVSGGFIRLQVAEGETNASVAFDITTEELQAIHTQLTEDLTAGD